jgi:DNA-binding NarL/FixJ family response regulator
MKTLRVLVVDDHDVVREGLCNLLAAQKQWQVCGEAASGSEAVEKTHQLRPDIVVLDFAMPDGDGLEATREIRKKHPQTEVLMLTVHNSEALIKEAFLAGAKAFVVKTETRRYLLPALENLGRHEPFFTSTASRVVLKELLRSGDHPGRARRSSKGLTRRERQIVRLIAEGKASKEIAAKLEISVRTVEAHRANLMRRLDIHSVGGLVRYAIQHKIIPD